MEALRVSAREVPLDAVAGERGPSEVLFRSTRADRAIAQVAVDGIDGKPEITAARSGWEGMVLVKTTGSSFATFARDDYTTLPDLADRRSRSAWTCTGGTPIWPMAWRRV